MSAVLLRVTAGGIPGAATYVAVDPGTAMGLAATAASGALAAVFNTIAPRPADDVRIATVPWTALPGIEPMASAELEVCMPGTVLFIGTTVNGAWSSWHPGGVPPDPP